MNRRVQAYFKSENDVMSVQATLQKLEVNHIFIDEISKDGDQPTVFPLVPATSSGGGVFTDSGSIFAAFVGQIGLDREAHNEQLTHLLEFEVADQDYEAALRILMENNGYVDQTKA